MKARLKLFDCLFVFVCLSIVLSDAVSAVINNTNSNVSSNASVQITSNLISTSSPSFVPLLPPNPQDDKNNPELAKRRAFVVEMMKHAWDGYVKCAWGKGNYAPLACTSNSNRKTKNYASYIWEAMPTLWIMGLRDEFNRARKWLEQADIYVDLQLKDQSNLFDTFVGSMLSCYALTGGEPFFLDRALNYTHLQMEGAKKNGLPKAWDWQNMQLEMYYLTHLTGNQSYRQYAQQVEQEMEKQSPSVKDKINWNGGNYLLLKSKQYVQSNYSNSQARMEQMYRDFDEMAKKNILDRTKSGLWYIEEFDDYMVISLSDKLVRADLCNIGAALSLGAMLMPLAQYKVTSWRWLNGDQVKKVSTYWQLANNFTNMCYWGSKLTSDYMIPFRVIIIGDGKLAVHPHYVLKFDAATIRETIRKPYNSASKPTFNLDSYQALESYFTLSRMTGELQKYRDSAWQMANKINQYTRVPNGFVNGLADKTDKEDLERDVQPSLFFTTLSYLYLMFTPDSYLPLDKWVINAAGYPLPVCGSGNPAYPNVKC